MTTRTAPLKLALLLASLLSAQVTRAVDDYRLGPDSFPQEGVPRGQVTRHVWDQSKVFPNTRRDYHIYVPAQYEATKPACVMVFQDGTGYSGITNGSYRVPVVFDNLIHRREMPVTIGIFINPGEFPAADAGQRARSNRSFEYDSLGDQYTRFLLEEILPEVGKTYNLTQDPRGRAIAGASSGGICAFTVAWERPDRFGKVFSTIGSFVNIRGGHVYPSLIRKTERKPIRVFLQDGSTDLDNNNGNWPLANQQMAAALRFASYDYQFVFGDGAHNGKHGGSIFPDAMRWLWRDYAAHASCLPDFSADAANPAMAPVTDNPALPRVLLIGDSISVGYTQTTREMLAGVANVHRIPENGGPTTNGLARIDAWLGQTKWDVIHFNWGLHDLKLVATNQHMVPVVEYEKNLDQLVRLLKETKAKLIWASITPVPEGKLSPLRAADDEVEYNVAARRVMAKYQVPINYLHTLARERAKDIQIPENVHFTPHGSKVLAEQVAASIRAALAK